MILSATEWTDLFRSDRRVGLGDQSRERVSAGQVRTEGGVKGGAIQPRQEKRRPIYQGWVGVMSTNWTTI